MFLKFFGGSKVLWVSKVSIIVHIVLRVPDLGGPKVSRVPRVPWCAPYNSLISEST